MPSINDAAIAPCGVLAALAAALAAAGAAEPVGSAAGTDRAAILSTRLRANRASAGRHRRGARTAPARWTASGRSPAPPSTAGRRAATRSLTAAAPSASAHAGVGRSSPHRTIDL
jgi:hypothetical protein